MYQRLATGPRTEDGERAQHAIPDMTGREKWVVAPLIAAFLVLGFYPKPVLDVLEPAVTHTLQTVGVSDPEPTVATTAEGSGR